MKTSELSPHERYGLPEEFYKIIEPYLERGKKVKTEEELIHIWEEALRCAKLYPEQRESIAECTISRGASTPYIHDNDIYEAIHLQFGDLEVADSSGQTPEEADAEWENQRKFVATLKKERAEQKKRPRYFRWWRKT